MTSQYTQTAQFLPSNLMADAFSSKTQNYTNKKDDVFSSVLDTASKTYTDKSDNKAVNNKDNKDYAQKTKDLTKDTGKKPEHAAEHTDNSQVKNDKKSDKNKITDKETPEKEHSKTETNDSKENANAEVKEKETTDNTVSNQEQNTPASDKSLLEQVVNNTVEMILDNPAADEAAVLVTAQITDAKTASAPEEVSQATTAVKSSDKNANTIVNEQILANIEYADTENLGVKAESLADIDIDLDALKKIVEQAKNGQTTVSQVQAQDTAQTPPQTLESVIENVKKGVTEKTPEMNVTADSETNAPKVSDKPVETAVKTAKENLASDVSRLTANVEQTVEDPALINVKDVKNVKPVTPADTELEKTPVIKVTEEVASQVKENTAAGVENKDTTTKVKGKAVEQMTSLQDTDTVVTESRTDSNNSNTGSGSNNSGANLSQGGAGELAAKLSVDQGAINNTQTGAEAFVNKLDAQLSAKGASSVARANTLNQTDIMSQVNAKFEELQKTGNNKVSIILQPENLGKVSVEIMNSKDGIMAKMTTDSQQVKELFDKNVEALKSNLSSQGVNVNNIKVECTQESANHGMENHENFEQQQFNQSNQQQNGQNQAHNQNTHSAYGSEYSNSQSGADQELNNTPEIKNTDTIIKHNGKVDYTV